MRVIFSLALLVSGACAQAATLTYDGNSVAEAEFATRVLYGINYSDPRSVAEQGFTRASDVNFEITMPGTVSANARHTVASWDSGVSWLFDGSAGETGPDRHFRSFWELEFLTDASKAITEWSMYYYTGSSDFVRMDLSDEGGSVRAEMEKAGLDSNGQLVCCDDFDTRIESQFAPGSWTIMSQPVQTTAAIAVMPLTSSLPFILAGMGSFIALRRFRKS